MLVPLPQRINLLTSNGFSRLPFLGPPAVPFYPFVGEGSPTKIDHRKSKNKYPYSNLSTRGPSFIGSFGQVSFLWGILEKSIRVWGSSIPPFLPASETTGFAASRDMFKPFTVLCSWTLDTYWLLGKNISVANSLLFCWPIRI